MKWVADHRAVWGGPCRRLLLFKWALCAAILCGMAVSPRIWLSARPYPTVPVLAGVPSLPQWLAVGSAVLLALLVLCVGLAARPGRWVFVPVALFAGLVVFDINRLQPCFYEYMLLLAALGLVDWEGDSRRGWALACFIVLSVYFWSGTQKANLTFASEVFPFLTRPLGLRLDAFWFVAPVVETGIGVCLLFSRTRSIGVVGAVLMHGFNLAMLGPFGLNYDSIIWPWNFWTAALCVILFFGTREAILRLAWGSWLGRVAVVLVGVMPAFNYVERWDGFLSMSYYSGRLLDAWIYFTPAGVEQLPVRYRSGNGALTQDPSGLWRMDVTKWAYGRINVPPYAEPRVYVDLMRRLEAEGVPGKEMTLLVRDRNGVASRAQTYSQVVISGR